MLFRKMLREVRQNAGQFLSILLLSFIALALYTGLKANVIGGRQACDAFLEETNFADGWIYGEGFTQENLEAVRALAFIEEAQLRTVLTGYCTGQDGAQVDIFLQSESLVNKTLLLEGEAFEPQDADGIWLSNAFAKEWDIQVGDSFGVSYGSFTVTKEVKGLIEMPEYIFRKADKDLDTDLRNIAIVYMGYAGVDLPGNFELPRTQLVFVTKDGEALKYEKEISEAIDKNYAVMVDERSIMGVRRLVDEFDQHDAFSYVFSMIFVFVAVLVIMTSMSRMVEKQRTQIGTLNAIGVKRRSIMLHYLSYSFLLSLIGAILGLLVGTIGLGNMMVDMFLQWFVVPDWKAGADGTYLMLVVVVVGACTLSAYISCRNVLRIKPSEALRPAPPKQGKHCLFEKLPFWNRLGFKSQYNLRDISRGKLRAAMAIIGTAAGMLLMVYGLACSDLTENMVIWSFEKIHNYESQLILESGITVEEADAICQDVAGELIMSEVIEIATKPNAVSGEKSKQTLTVLEGKGLYNVTDPEENVVSMKEGTIAITRRLAESMGVSVGDTIYWHIYSENDWYEAEIGLIYRSPDAQGITYLRSDYEKTGNTFSPVMVVTQKDITQYDHAKVSSVFTKKDIIESFYRSMSGVDMLVGFMVFFSVLLVVVVLYNSGNLSFHERVKEFATLKVMGFQSGTIRNLLTIQNLWLSVIGVLLGVPFGRMSLEAMMNSNGDDFDYLIRVPLHTYLLSALLVLGVSVLVSFLFSQRIKKLDMVEVLKGIE